MPIGFYRVELMTGANWLSRASGQTGLRLIGG